jgi:hypothetical protein
MRSELGTALLLPLQVFSLLFTKYLHCLDVRFYTLAAVTRLAQQHAVRGEAAAAGANSDEEDAEAAEGSGSMSSEDVSRVMFGVLSHITPIVPPKQLQDKDKQQQQQQQQLDLQSWCGAAEVCGRDLLTGARCVLSSHRHGVSSCCKRDKVIALDQS